LLNSDNNDAAKRDGNAIINDALDHKYVEDDVDTAPSVPSRDSVNEQQAEEANALMEEDKENFDINDIDNPNDIVEFNTKVNQNSPAKSNIIPPTTDNNTINVDIVTSSTNNSVVNQINPTKVIRMNEEQVAAARLQRAISVLKRIRSGANSVDKEKFINIARRIGRGIKNKK
jgi:hypothetical protein